MLFSLRNFFQCTLATFVVCAVTANTHAQAKNSLCNRIERRIAIATRQVQRLTATNSSKRAIRVQKSLLTRYTKQYNIKCRVPTVTPTPTVTATIPPQMCIEVYKPVCGRIPIPQTCLDGDITCVRGNNIDTATTKTYSNLCFLEADNATFLYNGPCKEPGVDDLWCGLPPYFCPPGAACFVGPLPPQTYRSYAELIEAGASPLHPGQCSTEESCKIDQPVCGILPDNCTKAACTNVMRVPQLFRNLCELERAGAKVLDIERCSPPTK